jgi:hypothetical protein
VDYTKPSKQGGESTEQRILGDLKRRAKKMSS